MKNGFTLVEMSLVLVIVAILIGGISGGIAVVKQAETRRVIAAIEQINMAYSGFVAEFNEIPGDMADASTYWSTTCGETVAACNGDGNGKLDHTFADNTDETLKAMKHLALAGFMNVNIPLLTATYTEPVKYAPAIKEGIGYNFTPTVYTDPIAGSVGTVINNTNIISVVIGKSRIANPNGWNDSFLNSAFSPREAYSVDSKIDDGQFDGNNYVGSNTGKVLTIYGIDQSVDLGNSSSCINTTGPDFTSSGQTYAIDKTIKSCIIYFLLNSKV